MNETDRSFVSGAIRRGRLFLGLSVAGVAVGAFLAGYYGYQRWMNPDYPVGLRAVIVILVLLNARQNLRQYRYALVLQKLYT